MPVKHTSASLRERTLPAGDQLGDVEVAQRVGDNLRDLRRKRDLSLDELAQRTGVSRAGLSQIETRKTNPTLGVLWKIAAGLGASPGAATAGVVLRLSCAGGRTLAGSSA